MRPAPTNPANPTISPELTANETYDSSPLWSPEDDRIAFTSSRQSVGEIYVRPVSGNQDATALYYSILAAQALNFPPSALTRSVMRSRSLFTSTARKAGRMEAQAMAVGSSIRA